MEDDVGNETKKHKSESSQKLGQDQIPEASEGGHDQQCHVIEKQQKELTDIDL